MPAVPSNAKMPTDRLKAEAAEEEVPGDTEFEHDGHIYIIDGGFVDDIEILEHLEDENNILALRKILGLEQWKQYKDRTRDEKGRVPSEPTMEFLKKLFAEVKAGN